MPPGIKEKWEDNNSWQQATLMGYEDVRAREEQEELEFITKTGKFAPKQ